MKDRIFHKILAVALLLTALFCLPALAEADVTRTVSTAQDLIDAVAEANQMAADAADLNTSMEWMNIVVTSDMELNQSLFLNNGVRVRMSGAEGKQYRISCSPNAQQQYGMYRFFGAYPRAELELSDLIFDGNKSNAGFMLVIDCRLAFNHVTIENFDTDGFMGGLISTLTMNTPDWPTKLSMKNCIVRNNVSRASAGGIRITHSDSVTDISDCTFSNNTVESLDGGALALSGTASIRKSDFTGNTSYGGGAIWGSRLDLTMSDCTFSNNRAQAPAGIDAGDGGGALHLQQNTTGTLTRCDFTGNTTDISGGAVLAFANTSLTFCSCNFKANTATTHGGAFCVADSFSQDDAQSSDITLNDCLLDGNKANGLDMSNQHKSDPFAPGGGAIYLHEYCKATLNANTVLQNNYARESGGAVYVSFGGRLTVNGAKIENNESGVDGGGIYVDGADAYSGYDHSTNTRVPLPDDGFATGGQVSFQQGCLYRNKAGRNGGGVYVGGENEVVVDGEQYIFTGGSLLMSGGVITENTALDMGGGVYVGACDTGDKGGILEMTDGAIYKNVAGENGNTSTGADDAGADVYSEGGNAYITVVTADEITAYIRSENNLFVPADHRTLYFTNWYDDYSDQDPDYGKTAAKIGTGTNTGRYMSSLEPDRMVYTPFTKDHAYNALILDYDKTKEAPLTGDATPLALYALLAVAAAAAMALLRRRRA